MVLLWYDFFKPFLCLEPRYAEGGAVTLNSANALLDMCDLVNDLLKDIDL